MRYTRFATLAAVAAPLLLIGSALQAHAAAPAHPAHTVVQVAIQNFAFSPQTLTVAPGTTVVWTNKDTAPHTVTSDTGAWTASNDLATGKTFSLTLTKPGTYTYHCAIHPTMTATLIVSSHGSSGAGTGPGSGGSGTGMGMGSMGSMSMTSMMAFTGYYDGHALRYLSTDTSNKDEAARGHINYAPSLAKSLATAGQIYLVTNGRYASRGAVFGSTPGATDYTPLWQEVRVTWKDPSQAVALGKDDQIKGLLEQLPENYRTVLVCRLLEGLSVAETARRMGTSEGNVKVLRHRALKRAAESREGDVR